MKTLLFILLLLCMQFPSCYTTSEPENSETLPVQPSSIQPTQNVLDDTTRIELYYPKPFQSLVAGEINFLFKTINSQSEIYIFNKQPDFAALGKGDFSGCVAGISAFAGHLWNNNTARLGATASDSWFYQCSESGPDILNPVEKAIYSDVLRPGTYYWFILGYDDNYMMTDSSEARIFMIL